MKDFDKWNDVKKRVNARDDMEIYFHEGDVVWSSMGLNIGYEEDGKGDEYKRPVLIIKKFNKNLFWGLSLTSKAKSNKYHIPIKVKEGKESYVIISQIKLFDKKRILQKIRNISKAELNFIKSEVIKILNPIIADEVKPLQ